MSQILRIIVLTAISSPVYALVEFGTYRYQEVDGRVNRYTEASDGNWTIEVSMPAEGATEDIGFYNRWCKNPGTACPTPAKKLRRDLKIQIDSKRQEARQAASVTVKTRAESEVDQLERKLEQLESDLKETLNLVEVYLPSTDVIDLNADASKLETDAIALWNKVLDVYKQQQR